ncbi:hypothetical protein VZQ01_08305 [Myxococcus faecalis]|uniref:hypothetical protein n=1 Tax=Myxococcus faecalis TaxID=3115646 RepID=UPI003CEE3444
MSAVERALEAYLFERFEERLRERLCKPPVVRLPEYFQSRFATLPELVDSGYDTWYMEVRFSTLPADVVEAVEIEATGLEVRPISYGFGVERTTQMSVRPLKRQTNHCFRINHLVLPGSLFGKILARLRDDGDHQQPLIANFNPGRLLQGYRSVSFDHMLTGVRVFCSCAKAAHAQMLSEVANLKPRYTDGSWPHQVEELLAPAVYQEGVCHLCVARAGAAERLRRYGTSIETGFAAYVDQVRIDMKSDEKTARAEVQQVLGLSRWVREAALYGVIRDLFPNYRVLRENSPSWLGRMRLDIFLPELNLAVEHQGEQHYRPLEVFGGKRAFAQTKERDALKKRLCDEHGVAVVYVRYDASISKGAMRQRLQRFLKEK